MSKQIELSKKDLAILLIVAVLLGMNISGLIDFAGLIHNKLLN